MFTDNLVFTILVLIVLAAMLNKARNWRDVHPQERLGIMLAIGACVVSLAIAALDPPWAGRWIIAILVAGYAGYQILYSRSLRRHTVALDGFAGETGMTAIRNPQEEKANRELNDLLKWMQKDLYRWKAQGDYPALVAKKGDWTLVIRVPHAVDFDVNAPDYTMFAFIRRLNVNTIMAARWPLRQEERPKKTFSTGDDQFDKRFYLTGASQASDDALMVFNENVREHMMSLSDLPGWVRVERFGVYYYMPGAVTSKKQIDQAISLLEVIGQALSEAGQSR